MPKKKNAPDEKPLDFEKSLKRLEKIAETLENENPPLNKSLELFQEGKKLSAALNRELESLEKKVRKILEESGETVLENFEPLPENDFVDSDDED